MSSDLTPVVVDTEKWLDSIAYFRVEVWKLNGMVDMSHFPDDKCLEEVDKIATHLIVERKGVLMAATRYVQYPDLASSHNKDYYETAGISLSGPIGLPEHTVVHPDYAGRGLGKAIADAHVRQAMRNGARYMITENSPTAAEIMRKRGRKSLGMAPGDPRFPNIEFEWMLSDMKLIVAELTGKN